MEMLEDTSGTLTSEIRARRTADTPTGKFVVILIYDNSEFLKFINERLINVYDIHVYNNIHNAAEDLRTVNADLIVCKENMP